MESNGILIKDNDKLFDIGYDDGYSRAIKTCKANPENAYLLGHIVKLPSYYEGYKAGVETALKEYEESKVSKK